MAKKGSAGEAIRRGIAFGSDETLGELLGERGVHPLRQLSVLRFVLVWGLFQEATGREPATVEELAKALNLNWRSVYRWQRSFREAFPEYQTPAVLWEKVGDRFVVEKPDDAAAMRLGATPL